MEIDSQLITEIQIAGEHFRVKEGSFEIGTPALVSNVAAHLGDATWVRFATTHGQEVYAPLSQVQFLTMAKAREHRPNSF